MTINLGIGTAWIAAASLVSLSVVSSSAWAQTPPKARLVENYFAQRSGSYLGIGAAEVTSERAKALSLKEERGVEITMVDADAPAGKAGLREHDVILDFNGTAVESEEQIRRLIREVPPGRTVAIVMSPSPSASG